jgi:hypothetical protein
MRRLNDLSASSAHAETSRRSPQTKKTAEVVAERVADDAVAAKPIDALHADGPKLPRLLNRLFKNFVEVASALRP